MFVVRGPELGLWFGQAAANMHVVHHFQWGCKSQSLENGLFNLFQTAKHLKNYSEWSIDWMEMFSIYVNLYPLFCSSWHSSTLQGHLMLALAKKHAMVSIFCMVIILVLVCNWLWLLIIEALRCRGGKDAKFLKVTRNVWHNQYICTSNGYYETICLHTWYYWRY